MYPFVFAAAAMALYFVIATLRRPRPAEILALILWVAYAVYEYYIANGTLCGKDCNIRVDLVLFVPILGVATYLALQKADRARAALILATICLALAAMLSKAFGYPALAAAAVIGAVITSAGAYKVLRTPRS